MAATLAESCACCRQPRHGACTALRCAALQPELAAVQAYLGLTHLWHSYTWGWNVEAQLGHSDGKAAVYVPTPVAFRRQVSHPTVKRCTGLHSNPLAIAGRPGTAAGRCSLLDISERVWCDSLRVRCMIGARHIYISRASPGLTYESARRHRIACECAQVRHALAYGPNAAMLHRSAVVAKSIACGFLHTLCLTDTGDVWSWGAGDMGQARWHTLAYSSTPSTPKRARLC